MHHLTRKPFANGYYDDPRRNSLSVCRWRFPLPVTCVSRGIPDFLNCCTRVDLGSFLRSAEPLVIVWNNSCPTTQHWTRPTRREGLQSSCSHPPPFRTARPRGRLPGGRIRERARAHRQIPEQLDVHEPAAQGPNDKPTRDEPSHREFHVPAVPDLCHSGTHVRETTHSNACPHARLDRRMPAPWTTRRQLGSPKWSRWNPDHRDTGSHVPHHCGPCTDGRAGSDGELLAKRRPSPDCHLIAERDVP